MVQKHSILHSSHCCYPLRQTRASLFSLTLIGTNGQRGERTRSCFIRFWFGFGTALEGEAKCQIVDVQGEQNFLRLAELIKHTESFDTSTTIDCRTYIMDYLGSLYLCRRIEFCSSILGGGPSLVYMAESASQAKTTVKFVQTKFTEATIATLFQLVMS